MKTKSFAIAFAALCVCLSSCVTPYGSVEVGYYKPASPLEEGAKLGAFTEVNPEAFKPSNDK